MNTTVPAETLDDPRVPPDASTTTAADVTGAVARLRGTAITLTVGIYLASMVAITTLLAAASPAPDVLTAAGVFVAGAVTTVVSMRLLELALRHADHLGRLSLRLTDLYDRARLDAIRDGLTGLGNHRAFQEELDRAGALARRHVQTTALLLLDVDGLKATNDSLGHAAGDEILQSVARIILANLRRVDRAFRIGGDEFAILCAGTSAAGGGAVARRMLAQALEIERSPIKRPISLTIGVSAIPDPSADRHLLYRHADAALYWGKRHGRTDVQVYDPSRHGMADDERPAAELDDAITCVIDDGLLVPMFQPIYSLASGAIVGFEGLVRPTAESGFRNATALFTAAETVARTVELDMMAVRMVALRSSHLGPHQYLAVNLSPRTLEASAFNPHEVIAVVATAGIEPRRLVIELTEREAVEDLERLGRSLQVLRRGGVRIAADDVGAGNAGLRLLSQLEFDIIKIDLSLVQSGAVLAPSRAVLRAICDLAARRGATTVAEGVETPLQLETLVELGIQVGQGYLLGMPRETPEGERIDLAAILAPLADGAARDSAGMLDAA